MPHPLPGDGTGGHSEEAKSNSSEAAKLNSQVGLMHYRKPLFATPRLPQGEESPATRNRTRDHLIAASVYSQMLYQLSYSRSETQTSPPDADRDKRR